MCQLLVGRPVSAEPLFTSGQPQANAELARRLLADMSAGLAPEQIASLFAEDAQFEVPGDDGVLPWIGYRSGREAAANYVATTRALTELLEFSVAEILASGSRAVIVGERAARIRSTGKVVETAFAIILTTVKGRIARFQMLEDSFAVSLAGRTS